MCLGKIEIAGILAKHSRKYASAGWLAKHPWVPIVPCGHSIAAHGGVGRARWRSGWLIGRAAGVETRVHRSGWLIGRAARVQHRVGCLCVGARWVWGVV